MARHVTLHCLGLLLTATGVARAELRSESEMAERINQHLALHWQTEAITPAGRATDAEFLRRAWLDLCGTIPPLNHQDGISGVRDFLQADHPDKREQLIQHLLDKPTHAAHFATIWRNVMIPPDVNVQRLGGDTAFQTWLRGQFADAVPYDQMVNDLLLATGAANQTGPALFYTSLQLQPEELAASSSRIFLGTQIQCAQCHDHPFDHWKRQDFWGYAAFFARLSRPPNGQLAVFQVADTERGEVRIPDTDEAVLPQFLGGQLSADEKGTHRRKRLAVWLTSAENPYFARATVNRVWALLFGRGLVDPVDDLGDHNPPSHPELLDELARYFVDSGFDLRRLLRTLAKTKAYQLSSQSSEGTEDRPELFARMAIKSLTAEQLYDCLAAAMRQREETNGQVSYRSRSFDQNRQAFLAKFRAPTQGTTDYESGIPQALTLMNGTVVRRGTDLAQSDLLVALDAPFFTDKQRVEVLFLSTVSRLPSQAEQEKMVQYVRKGGVKQNRRAALSDVLWALINSAEFVLNH